MNLWRLTLSDLTHPDDLQETNDNLNRLLAGEIETFSLEKRGIRKDGGAVWLNLTVSLHRDAVNGQNYFISVAEEISNRKETEKALQLTLSELEGSNAELQQFAYVASHDLQEPLRMISSYVQLLERRYKYKLGEDADDFISYAVDGAKRMQGLISDLLRLSRVGTREKSIETIDCEEVLDQALANLRVSIAECCAQVTREPLPTVTADATQIVQSLSESHRQCGKVWRDRDSAHSYLRRAKQWHVAFLCPRQWHWYRSAAVRPNIRNLPTPAWERRIPRHRHRSGHMQKDR